MTPGATIRDQSVSSPAPKSPNSITTASSESPPHTEDARFCAPLLQPSLDDLEAYLASPDDPHPGPWPQTAQEATILGQPLPNHRSCQSGGHLRGPCSYCLAEHRSAKFWGTVFTTIDFLFTWLACCGSVDIFLSSKPGVGGHVRQVTPVILGIVGFAVVLRLLNRLQAGKYSETYGDMIEWSLIYIVCYLIFS